MKTLRMSPEELSKYLHEKVEEGDRLELNYAFVHVPGRVVKVTSRYLHLDVDSEMAPGIRRYEIEEICSMMIEVVHEPRNRKDGIRILVEGAERSPSIGIL